MGSWGFDCATNGFEGVASGGLAFAGLLVIALIVRKVGWTAIRENLRAIGLWFPLLLGLNLVAQAAFVAGLRCVVEPRPSWRDFPRLYRIYMMGDAANYALPGGGEAAKAHLLRPLAGGEGAMAAIALHKHADLIAQCIFAVVGVGVALLWFHLPRAVAVAAILGTLALLAILLLMTWALRRGAFSPILRRLSGWKFLAGRLRRSRTARKRWTRGSSDSAPTIVAGSWPRPLFPFSATAAVSWRHGSCWGFWRPRRAGRPGSPSRASRWSSTMPFSSSLESSAEPRAFVQASF